MRQYSLLWGHIIELNPGLHWRTFGHNLGESESVVVQFGRDWLTPTVKMRRQLSPDPLEGWFFTGSGFNAKSLETAIRFSQKVPPVKAEYLFYFFLEAKTCDALVGDLEERYKLILKKFGKFKADLWYWSQAIRSTGPIAWAWFKKGVMKPVVTVMGSKIVHDLLKNTHLLEIVKTVLAEWLKRMRG